MQQKLKRILLIGAVPALALGWYAFRPELIFVNRTVQEASPSAKDGNVSTIASGAFESYAHETTGIAQILQVSGKRSVLRLSNFKTSNGPDVHVFLVKSSDPKDIKSGSYLDLGSIKGNLGDQNYDLPDDLNLADYNAVNIWCSRFSVRFGGASLKRKTASIPQLTLASFGPEIRVTSGSLTGKVGKALLLEKDGKRALRLTNLKLTSKADVYFVKAESLAKPFNFDSLTKVKVGTASGKFGEFAVSKDLDAWLYRSVLLWNPVTNKAISTADLRSDQERKKTLELS